MDASISNFLYREPTFYEQVYPQNNTEIARRMFRRYLGRAPDSILVIGCGTGRDLGLLADVGAECVGVDYQEQMVRFAREHYPHVEFHQGDMCSLRLGRTFDGEFAGMRSTHAPGPDAGS